LSVLTHHERWRCRQMPSLRSTRQTVSGERETVYFWRLGMHFFFGGSSSH